MPGATTSQVEVTNISQHGFWVLLGDRELFLPFSAFPWFRNASIDEILSLELLSPEHLYWPKLDVDLSVDSIDNPKRYPLVAKQ